MLDVLLVSFFQAVSGTPADLPAPPPAAAVAPGAPAAGAAGQATAPSSAPGAQAEPLRCRTVAVTGSRFVRRVCMTKAEEDQWRTDSRRWLEHSQSQMPTKGG